MYLIALQNASDLKKVITHAQKISKHLKKTNSDAVCFSALAMAKWKGDFGEMLCIGDNRKDSLIFYPIKEFKRHLKGFTYLPVSAEQNGSIFAEFESFCSHEMRTGANNSNENYKVIVMDFRKKAAVFVGNEADVIVRSLEYNFGNRASISLIYRRDNRAAYSRLEELLSERNQLKSGIIGERGKRNPFSSFAVSELF